MTWMASSMPRALVVLLGGLILSGCLNSDTAQNPGSGSEVEIINLEELVCNPFGGGGGDRIRSQGVHGKLYYIDPTQPNYTNVGDYIEYGHKVDELELFFNQIHVPTRPFDRAFSTMAGQDVKTIEGDNLFEWFALELDGQLISGEWPAGDYQLSLLSDDGAILYVDHGNGWEVLIDNDGTHPTRMACAVEPINLSNLEGLPFKLEYFQGPRYHISLVLMGRAWPSDPNDPECGRQGNSRFWDSTQNPPEPQAAYFGLLSRGWEVLSEQNFELIEPFDRNPCNDPAPTISNVVFVGRTSSSVTLSWNTDVPATSQLIYTSAANPSDQFTDEDLTLKTVHQVVATGLSANTIYQFRVRSGSSSGLASESSIITVRTSR